MTSCALERCPDPACGPCSIYTRRVATLDEQRASDLKKGAKALNGQQKKEHMTRVVSPS